MSMLHAPLHMSLLALGLAATAPAPATPAPPPTPAPAPIVSAIVEQCTAAVNQSERSVTFSGQMTAIAGAQRMAMRIEVQERTPTEAAFHTVTAGGTGAWRQSDPGVKIYKYLRQVTNLSAPASFRALVLYRWIDDKGRVMRHTVRRTPVCRQPVEVPKPAAGTPVRHTTSTPASAESTQTAA
jgi:hypothetical protein